MYGAPAVDGVTVKASVDGRGARATPDPDAVPRELTPEEIEKVTETVTEFFPGLIPTIVRSDAFPDLFTKDRHPLAGWLSETAGSTAPPDSPETASKWRPATATSPHTKRSANRPSKAWTSYARTVQDQLDQSHPIAIWKICSMAKREMSGMSMAAPEGLFALEGRPRRR